MNGLNRVITVISRAACYVCIVLIAVMMCAVFADVVMRFFFTRSIPGVTELAQGCWVLMALSFGVVALENANTMVDIFVLKMPPKVRRVFVVAVDIVAVIFCVIVGWRTVLKAISSMNANIMLVSLGIKEWVFIMLFAVSFFVCAAASVLVLIREIKSCNEECSGKTGNEAKEEV